jgi:hypothetical protein
MSSSGVSGASGDKKARAEGLAIVGLSSAAT